MGVCWKIGRWGLQFMAKTWGTYAVLIIHAGVGAPYFVQKPSWFEMRIFLILCLECKPDELAKQWSEKIEQYKSSQIKEVNTCICIFIHVFANGMFADFLYQPSNMPQKWSFGGFPRHWRVSKFGGCMKANQCTLNLEVSQCHCRQWPHCLPTFGTVQSSKSLKHPH